MNLTACVERLLGELRYLNILKMFMNLEDISSLLKPARFFMNTFFARRDFRNAWAWYQIVKAEIFNYQK